MYLATCPTSLVKDTEISVLQGRLDEIECKKTLLKNCFFKKPASFLKSELRKLEIDIKKIDGLIDIFYHIIDMENKLENSL